MKKTLLLTYFVFLTFSFAAIAQETQTPKTIAAGVVNGKAKSLPIPPYPAAAKAVKASGVVKVQVTIDENGDVVSAAATDGHPLLRAAAVEAARNAKFAPTTLSGQPVKVSGVIIYNFVGPSTTADKMMWLNRATFLATIREERWMQPMEMFLKQMVSEMPDEFAKEKTELLTLPTVTPEGRTETIDNVFTSLESKLSKSDAWQLEIGKLIAKPALEVRNQAANANHDFDETKVRENLMKINDLALTAPQDIPVEVVNSLKSLGSLSTKASLKQPETLVEISQNISQVMRTVTGSK